MALAAAGLGACGDDATPATAPTPPPSSESSGSVQRTGTGAGPPTAAAKPRGALARNRADANRFVGDGRGALEARLAALKGEPVVVNLWASWCGPCRHEFPFFAAAVKRHGARVAFLGIDVMDDRDGAEAFVEEEPPGFPSIYDGDGRAADSLAAGRRVMPTTFFLDRDGKVVHTKLGGYANAAQLDADIRRHALTAQ
jgi:thiol-disulfide isomerase/thioredoxin